MYPELNDDEFVKANLENWKANAGKIAAGHKYGDLIEAEDAIHTIDELKAGVDAHYHCVCGKYFTEDKVVDFLFEGKYYEAEHLVGTAFAYADVFGTVNDLIKWDNRRVSLDEAERAVHASSMSTSEKAAALQKLENAKKANYGTLAAMALPVLLAAAGIAIPFPASMAAWAMEPVMSSLYSLQSKRMEELKSSAMLSVTPAVTPAHIFAMGKSPKNYFLPLTIACTLMGRPNRLIKPSASFWL